MADTRRLQQELAQAEDELKRLTRTADHRDCAGKSRSPELNPAVLQRIEELEERVAQLRRALGQ